MGPEGLLPYFQEPSTEPYPEVNESSPHCYTNILILSYFCLIVSLLLRFTTNKLHASLISPMHASCPVHLIFLHTISNPMYDICLKDLLRLPFIIYCV
jgi:hypothetical protein